MFNHFISQFARDGHLSFRQKLRDLIIRIYGHESTYNNQNLADLANCPFFIKEFYRLKQIELPRDLAYRKIFNPFKLVEFLLTAPLELLSWSLYRLMLKIVRLAMRSTGARKQVALSLVFRFVGILSIFTTFAVNLITGVIRRCLAPVRYLVRPSIELAKLYPKTFVTICILTVLLAAFSAGLLPLLAAAGFALTAGVKLAFLSVASLSAWSFLLKAATTLRELGEIFQKSVLSKFRYKSPSESEFRFTRSPVEGAESEYEQLLSQQWDKVDALNNQKGYMLYTMRLGRDINTPESAAELEDELITGGYAQQGKPLLIDCGESIWICGNGPKNVFRLAKLSEYTSEIRKFMQESLQSVANMVVKENDPKDIPEDVYPYIAFSRGHIRERKPGTTAEISRTLHAINPELVELKPVELQVSGYSFALFMGLESILYPKRQTTEPGPSNDSEAKRVVDNEDKHEVQNYTARSSRCVL